MGQVTRDGYILGPLREQFYCVLHAFLPLASGAVQVNDSVGIDGQADFVVDRQAALADDGQASLQFQLAPGQLVEDMEQYLTSYGTGQFPRVLPSPWVIPRGGTFSCVATDRQTVPAANTVRFLSIGRKVYDTPYMGRRRYPLVKPFTLTANFTTFGPSASGSLASGSTGLSSVNVSSEWDFEVRKLVILADGPFTMQVRTTGKAMSWFNKAVHSTLLGGTPIAGALIPSGAWPFVLPAAEFVPATGGLQVEVADLSVSPSYPNRIKVSFLGNRLYPPGGLPSLV